AAGRFISEPGDRLGHRPDRFARRVWTLALNSAASSGHRTYDQTRGFIAFFSLLLANHLSLVRRDNNPDEISFAPGKTAEKRLWVNEITPLLPSSTKLDLCELKRENDFLIRHGRSSDTEVLNLHVREP
ncbi:Uncharacterized protein DBV15_01702, partial [Temnothorax longispinosus]